MRRNCARYDPQGQTHLATNRVSKNVQIKLNLRLAYIEFANKESAIKAKHLNESLFKGRQLTVIPKRKNKPGMGSGRGGFNSRGANPMALMLALMRNMQGRGMRGGIRGRGGFRGRGRGGDAGAGQEQK